MRKGGSRAASAALPDIIHATASRDAPTQARMSSRTASSMPVMTEVNALTSMIEATSTYNIAVDGTQLHTEAEASHTVRQWEKEARYGLSLSRAGCLLRKCMVGYVVAGMVRPCVSQVMIVPLYLHMIHTRARLSPASVSSARRAQLFTRTVGVMWQLDAVEVVSDLSHGQGCGAPAHVVARQRRARRHAHCRPPLPVLEACKVDVWQ